MVAANGRLGLLFGCGCGPPGRGGPTALWSKGVSATFFGVDISRIEIKGNAGDMALVVGTG